MNTLHSNTSQKNTTSIQKTGAATTVFWVLQIGLAVMFVMSGANKLIGTPDMIGLFEAIGIGQWFRYVTGIIELVAATLLIIPRLAIFGALTLAGVMGGALLTHLFIIGGAPWMALMYLVFSLIVIWFRRDELKQIPAAQTAT